MVFRHATLVFSTPGTIFGTPIPDLDPGWAGDLFCPKMGPGKRWFCGRNGPPWGCTGFCKRGMDCMVPRRPLGKAVSPQTLPENHFLDLPGFRDRFGGRPGAPWWIPIVPLWANRPIGPVWGLRWSHTWYRPSRSLEGAFFPRATSEGFLLCTSSAGVELSFPVGLPVRCRGVAAP